MVNKLIILSDIHGNLNALESVINDFEERGFQPSAIALLGDCINYGMRPNEVIERLDNISERYEILVNIFGNHEKALMDGDTSHFSTDRGKHILTYTRNQLTEKSMTYIMSALKSEGYMELEIVGKKCLFIHGSLEDPYWGKLNIATVDNPRYAKYDYVISGHSHVPHLIEHFFDVDNHEFRNRKRTVFLNPGSVGQPRNQNPRAQYLFIDFETEIFHFNSVKYDVKYEQNLYEGADIDSFYKTRLTNGI